MSDEVDKPAKLAPRSGWFSLSNPIGLIGAHAALVEVGIIAAAIFMDGWQQWAMIVFSVVAFFYISHRFFGILVNQNWVLYPPKEYGGDVDVDVYVDAMRKRGDPPIDPELMKASILEAVTRPEVIQEVVQALPDMSLAPKLDEWREAVARSLTKAAPIAVELYAERNFLNFEFVGPWKQMSSEDRSITLPYTALWNDAISMLYLLARLGLSTGSESDAPDVAQLVFHYGKSWELRNRETGTALPNVPIQVTMHRAGVQRGPVTLQAVGIEPGMTLDVVSLQ